MAKADKANAGTTEETPSGPTVVSIPEQVREGTMDTETVDAVIPLLSMLPGKRDFVQPYPGEVYADRNTASKEASKFVRFLSSRGHDARSRTWAVEGGYTFGVRPKG
jgi:hypothetical protein